MSTEQNKAIVRRFLQEGINKGNAEIADELFSPDFISHFVGVPGPLHGVEAWKQLSSGYFTAFPDLHVTAEDYIAEGDKVVARWTWRGTHLGAMMGIPPTSKQVNLTGMGIYRIVGNKIAEQWVQEDLLGMLQQLGVIPAPEQAHA